MARLIMQAGPIADLTATRRPLTSADIELEWSAETLASGYNLWIVDRKVDIDRARQATQPPAVPVLACAAPSPTVVARCTDVGAVPRGAPGSFFYQVRAFCNATTEGP